MELLDKSKLLDKVNFLKKENSRFLIATAYFTDETNKEIAISYNFDKNGEVITYKVIITDKVMPSLINIFGKAVEWCEREINENFQVEFTGLCCDERFIKPDEIEKDLPTFGTIKITTTEV